MLLRGDINQRSDALKKIFVCTIAMSIGGCTALTQPNSNYVRAGLFHDRFDGMYYHYAETGKTIAINDHNSVNASVGLQQGGGAQLINNTDNNLYWEINYQLTF